MGAEPDAPAAVADHERHRPGIAYPNPLAGKPGAPRFAATVKRQDGSELAVACPKATRLSLAMMNMNAVHGGAACHWGGPSAFAEIAAAVHGIAFASDGDWRQAFNLVNDAGHAENGIYALKANYGFAGVTYDELKGFRSIASRLTGHGESHLFADGVMVSNGPLGSSLPIAQGLALADRVADNDRVTCCIVSDGALMEGEAKESLAALPGFAAKDQCNPFVMVLSDNNTKLSGRIDAQSFTMQPSFEALQALGWQVITVAQGHDLQGVFTAVEQGIAQAHSDRTKPVVVWVKTIKGKGVKKTEENAAGGHGYPLKNGGEVRAFAEEINGGPVTDEPWASWLQELEAEHAEREAKKAAAAGGEKPASAKVQAGFPKAMIAAAEDGLPVVSVSADLQGSTGIAPFHSRFPQFSREVGISEANMVSTGAGFSKQGFIPVVDTFVQFGATKGNLPLVMGILSQSPVIGVFTHCGFQDAADGASHQGLYYLAATAAIPHLQQYCPATAEEAEWAMDTAIRRFADQRAAGETPDAVLFFCGRENFPVSLKPAGADYEWGKAMVLADTTAGKAQSVTISAVGYLASYALQAVDELEQAGIGAVLLQNSTPNHPDLAGHQAALAKTGGKLVTVEDHQLIGGAGSMLVSVLADAGTAVQVERLGVDAAFGQSAYEAVELYDKYGYGPQGMVAAAKRLAP